MNNSKIVSVLRTFSKIEMKEFEKFVSSSYYNKGRNYLPLMAVLKKFHPKFDDDKLTPQYIYGILFPGKEFNRQIIWNQTSSLFHLAEEYLAHHWLKRNLFEKDALISGEYKNRKLAGLHLNKIKEMEKLLEKSGIEGNYFRNKARIQKKLADHYHMLDMQHLLCDNILKKGEYEVISYVKGLSDIMIDLAANAFMFNANYDFNIPAEFINNLNLKELIEYARKNKYEHSEMLEIYYRMIELVINIKDTSNYFRLMELFKENHNRLSLQEKNDIITAMTNYCVTRSNETYEGQVNFRGMLFELNKLRLEIESESAGLPGSKILFLQILRNALAINEIDWAQDYINKYVPKLKKSHQKPMYSLAMGLLNFRKSNFNDILSLLKDIKFIDVRDKLLVKSLAIRTYFELGETEMVLYQIDSMRHFLSHNDKINNASKKLYSEFLNFMGRIISYKDKRNKSELEFLKHELKGGKTILNENWLIEKADEIIASL